MFSQFKQDIEASVARSLAPLLDRITAIEAGQAILNERLTTLSAM